VPHLSFCRICAAACGIVVTVDGDQVQKVRGDPAHPVSRGYTCPKGRALPAFHHRNDRLDHPVLAGTTAPWGAVLDDLAHRLGRLRAEHGPGSIGVYLGTGLAYDIAGWLTAERLIATLGTPQRYTPVTIDNAPALLTAEMVGGSSQLNPVWDPAGTDLLVLFGTNPVVSHGYGTALADPVNRLRDFRAGGGRIWVIDPRRTETAALADRHLPLRAGTDHLVLALLARSLLHAGADGAELDRACDPDDLEALSGALAPFDRDTVARATGLDPGALDELVAAVRAGPGRLASMAGTGVMMSQHGLVAEWLRWVVLVLSGSLDRTDGAGMRFNDGVLFPLEGRLRAAAPDAARPAGPASRPELSGWGGQLPCVSMADEIEAGNLRGLLVAGGSPLTAFPEPSRIHDALGSLDVLAVLDVVRTPLTAMASHVLPATGQLERADLSMLENVAFRNGTAFTPPVVAAAAERRPAWWIVAQLARRLGLDALGGERDPDQLDDVDVLRGLARGARRSFDEIVAAGPHGSTETSRAGWVHDAVLPEGRWRLAPEVLMARLREVGEQLGGDPGERTLVMVPRRRVRSVNATSYGAADPAGVVLHPLDADAVGVTAGGEVLVRSTHGAIVGPAVLDDAVARGTVALTHGRTDVASSELVSAHLDVDPLTGMPLASGVPVDVEPAG
jgi:anaerobic selenocysteine-containing dehydrogenase